MNKELGTKYFTDVKYYHDDKDCAAVHRTVELFNNGVLTYDKMIQRLSKSCNDTLKNIHSIVKKYIDDFGDYEYKNA